MIVVLVMLTVALMALSYESTRNAPIGWFQLGFIAPARTILRRAEAGKADLIALETHGRRGLSRLLLGSVAARVLKRTHVPLFLQRPAGDQAPGAAG